MNYYEEIKNELIENEIYKKAKDYSKSKSDLMHYYNVGKLLVDAQGGEERARYGDGLIKEYSMKLTNELGQGYSTRNLKRMRKFYIYFQKGTTLSAQSLSWSHYVEILSLDDIDEINYYIEISISNNLGVRSLREKIKSKEYQRLDNNTKNKLVKKEETVISDFIKNPIVIKNNLNIEIISEKYLKKLILEDIESFMRELGDGFSFIGSEYKIKLGNTYNYIDLLLFNYKYNAFIVVELKITELRKEYIGQVEVYMNYIDKHIKNLNHGNTIGIIICKRDNKLVLEYASDSRIFSSEFILV